MGDEVGPDGGVTLGLLGVVADHEPLRAHAAVPAGGGVVGVDVDLLEAQVARHRPVPTRPGQRGPGVGVGVPQLLGVDVVPAALGEVGPVRL